MLVVLGCDHAGYALKGRLAARLGNDGYDVVDVGATAYHEDDDYPGYCIKAAETALARGGVAIVIGGSGNGEAIAANKVRGARAALCGSPELARLAREHNNANVLSLGARFLDEELAYEVVRVFLDTAFSGDERHARRIRQIAGYEG